jgi:solute carrier family 25 folate transporter 32
MSNKSPPSQGHQTHLDPPIDGKYQPTNPPHALNPVTDNSPTNSLSDQPTQTTPAEPNTNNPTKSSFNSKIAWISGASGVISGFLATILLHPLEVLKIRLQGDAAGKSNYRFSLREVVKVSRKVGLYSGMSANLIASMVAWGVFFGSNDYFRILGRDGYTRWKCQKTGQTEEQTAEKLNFFGIDFATSMAASTLAQIATQPLWLMKTRMSLDLIPLNNENMTLHHERLKTSPYRSLGRGLLYTAQTEGLRGLYRGFSASLLGTTHGAIMMCSYNYFKELKSVQEILSTYPQWLQSIILPSYAAFMSKVVATIATYPTQVLRTAIQDHRLEAEKLMKSIAENNISNSAQNPLSRSSRDILCQQAQRKYGLIEASGDIFKSSGIRGFYRGVSMQVLRASLQNVVVFGVYEGSKSIFSEKAHIPTNTSIKAQKD